MIIVAVVAIVALIAIAVVVIAMRRRGDGRRFHERHDGQLGRMHDEQGPPEGGEGP